MPQAPENDSTRLHGSVHDVTERMNPAHATGSSVPIDALRRVALEAGIDPHEFETTLRRAAGVRHAQPPAWVRIGMLGVPDRAAAMGFYWMFIVALVALIPAVKLQGLPESAGIFAAVWLVFSSVSTTACVRWLDKHGWQSLG